MGYTSNTPASGIPRYANAGLFPVTAQDGEQAVDESTSTIYIYQTMLPGWVAVANAGAAIAIDALTGEVTAVGPGVVAATITPAAVTNAKLAAMSDNTIKGNKSGGPASPTDLALSAITELGSSILNIVGAANSIVGSSNVTIEVAPASAVQNGYLTSVDWNTFDGKQAPGNYITDLTSDVSASGPGSAVASVNSVGGKTALEISDSVDSTQAATSSAVDDTLVLRDGLGNFDTASMAFDLSPSPTPSGAEGKLKWNSSDGTLDLGMGGGNVTQQIGQEQYVRIVNKSGATITDGQVVRVVGAQGQRAEGELALADSIANAKNTIGIATEDILNNQEGFITTFGLVRGLNTNAYAEGDILYLSPTIPGGLTNVPPANTYTRVQVGIVIVDSPNGSILVQVHFEPALGEISNVVLTAPSDGQVLEYDSGSSSWINATLVTLPSQASADEKVLASNGTSADWFYAGLGDGNLGDHNCIVGQAKPASLGTYNTLVGVQNATSTTGSGNAIFGSLNAVGLTTGSQNTFLGTNIQNITTGTGNIALGNNIYFANGAYTEVISIGNGAGITGSAIIAIGASHNVQGSGAVSIGYQVNSVNSDVNIGFQANSSNSSNSIIIGRTAHSGSGANAVIIGSSSGKSGLSGANNTVVGQNSFNSASLAGAGNNTMIGYHCGYNMVGGGANTFVGMEAGAAVTNGNLNTLIGRSAGASVTGFDNAVCVGYNSDVTAASGVAVGQSSSAGSGAVALGPSASSGTQSVALGGSSKSSGTGGVTLGYSSGAASMGNFNTLLGSACGTALTGASNIFLGYTAGDKQTSNNNLLIIDNQTRASAAAEATDSIIYGVMAATPATQTLSLNAVVSVPQGIKVANYIISPSTDASLGTVTGAFTIDWALSPVAEVTLNAAGPLTITLSNPVNGGAYAVKITQGATPGTVSWPGTVKWPAGTAPTLSTVTGDVDVINLIYFSSTTSYYGTSALDFA